MKQAEEIQNKTNMAHEVITDIFHTILPKYGLIVRDEQVRLSHNMFDALNDRKIALSDAGVGIGKTYAYLVAVIVHHVYLPENWWVKTSYHHDAKFNMGTPMPIIISTSSIALQKAIVHEYIPFLSSALMGSGIINQPLRSVVRKGKSNYVCDRLLRLRLSDINLENKNPKQREALLSLSTIYDLDQVQDLSMFDRKQICVPSYCSKKCDEAHKCRYQRLLRSSKAPGILFQICNHNYLLADTLHRSMSKEPLLPNYKAVIIDEAHKLYDAAKQMYGLELSEFDLLVLIQQTDIDEKKSKKISMLLKKVDLATRNFFETLSQCVAISPDEDIQRYDYEPSSAIRGPLYNLILSIKAVTEEAQKTGMPGVESRFEELKDKLFLFYWPNTDHVRYLEYSSESKALSLHAVPKKLQKQLSSDLWSKPVPFLLTSGTLAVNGDFTRTRAVLGMEPDSIRRRITEFTASSPFDYQRNCLLYLPEDLPYPKVDNPFYLDAVARKIGELVWATHGHTLILFTSYEMMYLICDRVQKQNLLFPVMIAWKNSKNIIDRFKIAENAVLFSTGACWEGIDFPGDMVSSLIIVTLPFSVPDPLSRYEQTQYSTLSDFISASIVPDMQKKLKQGFGRAIRTETDSCAVSILDSRARFGGKYHQAVLDTLPPCHITNEISHVAGFIQHMKDPQYFSIIKEVI